MKNFTNNFKQFTSRLSARWLIMALMLLVGTSSAWGITIYYDNSQTPSYSKVYLHLGHDSYIKSYEMEFDAETSLYHKSWNQIEWNDAKYIAFTGQAISTDGLENKFTDKISTYYTINMGGLAAISDYLFSSSGANADPISIRIKNILNLNYIGFYIVENDNWNQSSFAAITSESAYGATDVYHSDGSDDGQGYVIGIVYAPSDKYNLTHSASWNNCPKMTSNAELGYAYYITGDHKYNSEEGTAPSCDFSIDNTIKAGETSTKSVTSSGKSKYGTQDYSEDSYYVKKSGETSLTKLEVVGNELQTQSLSVGEYTIYLLLFDGRIYAKGGEQTLTVETACEKPSAPDFGTNGVEVCEGTQVTLPTIADVTLKWYDENNQETTETFNATENKTYYAVVVGDCESDKTPYAITIKTKPTVTLNPTENTVCSGVALEGITRYVKIESTEGSQISWYAATQGGDALAPSIALDATSYFAEATLNGCSSDRAEFTITDVLSAPTEVPDVTAPETICDGESAVLKLNNKDANYTYKVNEDVVAFTNNEYTVSPAQKTTYKITAENKCGSKNTDIEITVNPLPTITEISGNNSAVLYEDVELTATGVTQGAEVKWYLDNDETVATGTTYVVTSENAGEVTVKAKAFLNGCESAEPASHTVNFEAEGECETGRTKIYFRKSYTTKEYYHFNINDGVYLYAWNSYTNAKYTGEYPGTEIEKTEKINGTEYYVYEFTEAQSTENLKIIVRATYDYCSNNYCEIGKTRDIALDVPGATYTLELANGDTNKVKQAETEHKKGDSNTNYDVYLFDVNKNSTGGGITITAPAVKTVSVTSDEDGNVTMVGQVVKTGCDTQAILGLQYKKQKQDGTYDDNYTTYPNPGTKEAISAGKTFTVTTKLEDGTYLVCARIDNSHATNGYGEDIKVVVNTTKTPISNVTLNYCDENGGNVGVDPNPMCKGATAYVKLDYAGSNYSDIKWLVEGVETNLVTDKGNGVVWSYIIQGTGQLSVELRNDANKDNEGNPTWATSDKLSFTMKAEPAAPYISIDPASGIICQGTEATITVTNPENGVSYKLNYEGKDQTTSIAYTGTGNVEFAVTEAGTYLVKAETTNGTCKGNAVSIAREIQVITTSISFEGTPYVTTPWEPITIIVNVPKGYNYTFNDTQLTQIASPDTPIKKVSGSEYTYSFPRPQEWGTGNFQKGDSWGEKTYTISATLNGVTETCGTTTATVKLQDEGNDKCTNP